MSHLTSCKGLLLLLMETDLDVIQFALNRLNTMVDEFWYELSSHLVLLEELHESADLPESARQLAALVASKVYFHLGEYDDSIHFALEAASLFNPKERSLYTDTLLGRCIDMYVAQRSGKAVAAKADPRLEELFSTLAAAWQAEDDSFMSIKELIGLMIKASRLDLLEILLRKYLAATKSASMLTFTLQAVNLHVNDIEFRRQVIEVLTKLYADSLSSIDYFSLTQCYIFLDDSTSLAKLLHDLLRKGEKLIAYQVSFDLFDHASQELLNQVTVGLKGLRVEGGSDNIDHSDEAMLVQIMNGTVTTQLYTKFLYSQCMADIHVLNTIKKGLDPRNSITHNATLISNALMYSGTTIDGFMRDNLEWVGRASNWAKFTATACVGTIHRGHVDQAMTILKPYLPNGPVGALPFQEAGALYALGLIHAPVGAAPDSEVMETLKNALRTYAANEPMVHGASLGLGLTAMGLHSESLFDSLFACVSAGDAVAGEGASIGLGLIMMGSGKMEQAQMLLQHAKEDQKEKTIRGLSMAIGLMMMGVEAKADALIDEMLGSSDPWVRVGGCYTLGLAYAGTSNYQAVERLLAIAVKDVSDEVKRTAVAQIGFVTFLESKLCVDMTRILADSYNPHIRYGVAMAVGVAAAGTGSTEALKVLQTLTADVVDFVRQGAIIAMSMVLIQITEKENPAVKAFRDLIAGKIADRKEDTCTKFGCIVASGILDAGGRNCTIALHKQRHPLKKNIAGLFLFTQYWYWFPLSLMLSLTLTPTCVIGLNEAMLMPTYQFVSNAPPSRFAPPKSVLVEKKEAKEKTKVGAVLSTTAKVSEYKKRKQGGAASEPNSPTAKTTAEMPVATVPETPVEKKEEEEPTSTVLKNPARVTMSQFAVVSHTTDARYRPLKPNPIGVVMLKDDKPDLPTEEVSISREDLDVKPPEPFEWP